MPTAPADQSASDAATGEDASIAALPVNEAAVPPAEPAEASAAPARDDFSQQQTSVGGAEPAEDAAAAVAEALAVAGDGTPDLNGAIGPHAVAQPLEPPSGDAATPNGAIAQEPAHAAGMAEAADGPASDGAPAAEAAGGTADAERGPTGTAAESPPSQAGLADLLTEDGIEARILKPAVGPAVLGSLTQQPRKADEDVSTAEGRSAQADPAEHAAADVPGKPPLPRPDSSKALQQQQQPAADGKPLLGGLQRPDKLHMVGSIPDMSAAWKAKVAVSDETQVL